MRKRIRIQKNFPLLDNLINPHFAKTFLKFGGWDLPNSSTPVCSLQILTEMSFYTAWFYDITSRNSSYLLGSCEQFLDIAETFILFLYAFFDPVTISCQSLCRRFEKASRVSSCSSRCHLLMNVSLKRKLKWLILGSTFRPIAGSCSSDLKGLVF